MSEINAAPRKGARACPETCRVMSCCRCGSEVLVNNLFPPTGTVHCMECAQELAAGGDFEWRFPYDKQFGELFDHISGQSQADNQTTRGRREQKWWRSLGRLVCGLIGVIGALGGPFLMIISGLHMVDFEFQWIIGFLAGLGAFLFGVSLLRSIW